MKAAIKCSVDQRCKKKSHMNCDHISSSWDSNGKRPSEQAFFHPRSVAAIVLKRMSPPFLTPSIGMRAKEKKRKKERKKERKKKGKKERKKERKKEKKERVIARLRDHETTTTMAVDIILYGLNSFSSLFFFSLSLSLQEDSSSFFFIIVIKIKNKGVYDRPSLAG